MLKIHTLSSSSRRIFSPELHTETLTSHKRGRVVNLLSHGKSVSKSFMSEGEEGIYKFLQTGKNIEQRTVNNSVKNEVLSSLGVRTKIYNDENDKEAIKNLWMSKLPVSDSITQRIDDLVTGSDVDIKNFYCLTFIGYSGLGYESPVLLKETLKSKLKECLQKHPDKQIIVVCGGTRDGIGAVYNLVEENDVFRNKVKCIGIVSKEAENNVSDLALNKDKIVFVPDPDKSWKTKSSTGYQYMLYPAHKYGGEVLSLGGGEIGYDEVKAAQKNGIKTSMLLFRPDREQLQRKLQNKTRAHNSFAELCPIIYHEFGVKS